MRFSVLPRAGIARRLILGFGSIILMLVGVAGWSAIEIHETGGRLRQIIEINDPKMALANLMLHDIDRLAIQVRTLSLTTDPLEIDATAKTLAQTEDAYDKAEASLLKAVSNDAATADEERLLGVIAAAARKTTPFIRQAAKQGQEGANMDAAVTLSQLVRPAEMAWRASVMQLIGVESALNGAAYERALAGQRQAAIISGLIVVLALVAASTLAWRITRSVTVPVDSVIKVAERIAEGDLTSTIAVTSKDEIGRLLNSMHAMQVRLRGLVGAIHGSAQSIEVASAEVAVGNQDLSRRTELTASSLQSTANSVERLTAIALNNDCAAQKADQLAVSASHVAAKGEGAVTEVVAMMGEISASSHQIFEIIGVIDSIAFQTNILSLNAAVEAARAGERGRGFAVVAAEVRALAERCASAARETKALISTSVDRVAVGSELVQNAGSTMSELLFSVRGVSEIIGEIRAASGEQSAGISMINASVSSLDQMTRQNAALVEESAAAAEGLKNHASMLAEIVSTFRLERGVGSAPATEG